MKDLFSKQSDIYAKYRPGYPASLIDYIISFAGERNKAWDCATGNGQAAVLLAQHFNQVIATDISQKQLSQAKQDPKIEYLVSPAEKTPFPDNVFDLITVAQAYHWFQFRDFFQEATRVGKNHAIVAVWGYGLITIPDPAFTVSIRHFYTDVVGKYWDAERNYVDEEYRTVPFPFEELPSRPFHIVVEWNRAEFEGYLNTWSSVQHYIKANNSNPVETFSVTLKEHWPHADEKKSFSFPVFLRIGRIVK